MVVSIGVVALNEERYIRTILNDIKNQTYDHSLIEVILVDGLSEDDTKQYMEAFKCENCDFRNIVILDNNKKKQAIGWNLVIKEASGDVITRLDGHATIPKDFISKNVRRMECGENITGGIRPNISLEDTPWQNMLLLAETSMFGGSFAKYRNRIQEISYVKSMFHATYRREVFQTVGGFNENLGRTEDNELHYRIRKAGYQICLDPAIVSYQYVRSSLSGMLKQKYGNGYWIGVTFGVCPGCISFFHFVPFLFLLGLLFTVILIWFGIYLPFLLLLGAYSLVNIVSTIQVMCNNKWNWFSLLLPMVFLLLHIVYGMGTVQGLCYLSKFNANWIRRY